MAKSSNVEKVVAVKKYIDNHASVLMFLSAWICWPVCIWIFRNIYVTPMPWHECIRITTAMIAFCSVVFFFMGLMIDATNRDKLKRAFLRKLES